MILSKFSYGPSQAILRIASKFLLSTQQTWNHSQLIPKCDLPNHHKHSQLTINPPTLKSNINVPRTSMHPRTSSFNLQSIYCQDVATIAITTITHDCKTKRKDEKKTSILIPNSMYPCTRLTSGARSEATH